MATTADIIDSILKLRTSTPEADLLGSITFSAINASAAGNVVIDAPTSGTSVLINSTGGSRALSIVPAVNTAAVIALTDGNAGNEEYFLAVGSAAVGTFSIRDATVPADRMRITNAGVVSFYEGTNNVGAANVMQVATVESGSFTGTLTGCTTSPTTTINWARSGNIITLNMAANLTATSNTTACTITGLPAGLSPTRLQRMAARVEDNTVFQMGTVGISAGATTLDIITGSTAAFTAAGTKGCGAFVASYLLN